MSGRTTSALDPSLWAGLLECLTTEELAEVLQAFLCEAHRLIDLIGVAQRRGDATAMAAHSHSLKGASLSIGAAPLAETCRQMEITAGKAALEGAAELVQLLAGELSRLPAAFEAAGPAGCLA